jgi:hypothetical protein
MSKASLFAIGVAGVLLAGACEEPMQPGAPPPSAQTEPDPEVNLTAEELLQQRAADLIAITTALDAYKAARGSYPVTLGFRNIAEHGPDWIPGLAPEFIPSVPREPLRSSNANRPQYWYVSDGAEFKMIVHSVSGECGPQVEQFGVKPDPARSNADGSCWAFGLFSEGLKAY